MRWKLPAGGVLELVRDFISRDETGPLFEALRAAVPFREHTIRIMGREVLEPRLSAWVGDPEATYTYSGIRNEPLPWPSVLAALRPRVSQAADEAFNGVLCNLYRDGRDSMGFHADDEPELGPEPVIASLSLGAVRRFQLRHRRDKRDRLDLDLPNGSLLLMRGPLQRRYRHAVPKEASVTGARINLTFRHIRSGPASLAISALQTK